MDGTSGSCRMGSRTFLYADRLIDKLIDEAAAIWAKEYVGNEFGEEEPISAHSVRRLLKEVSHAANGVPSDVLDQIIEQGQIRYKSEGVKQKAGLISVALLKDRFNKRFDQQILPDSPTTPHSEKSSPEVDF